MALLKIIANGNTSFNRLCQPLYFIRHVPSVNYAKKIGAGPDMGKKGAKAMLPSAGKKKLAVETDPEKLMNYVCGTNLLKEGGEDVKLKDDSEYPDWLWKLSLDGSTNLDDLDPNTLDYWYVLRNKALKTKINVPRWKRHRYY